MKINITKHMSVFYLWKSSSFLKSILLSIILGLVHTSTIHPSSMNEHRMTILNSQLLSNPSEWIICGPTSWEDLKNYLPEAKMAGITISVILLPPFQSTVICSDDPYSEPFGNDYILWAQEIATLSLRYSNLTEFGIYNLRENLSLGYLRQTYIDSVITAANSINPRLQFIIPYNIWYVDRDATGTGTGTSWVNASKTIRGLPWTSIAGGDTVYISGGTDSTVYLSILNQQNNSIYNKTVSTHPIVVTKSWEAGHNGDVYFTQPAPPRGYAFDIQECTGIKLTGLKFNTSVSSANGTNVLLIYQCSNIIVDNCEIISNGTAAALTIWESDIITVNNCHIEVLSNNYAYAGGNDAVYIGLGNGGHTITNNTVIQASYNDVPHIDVLQMGSFGSIANLETVVANNFLYYVIPQTPAEAAGMIYFNDLGTNRLLIYNNIIVYNVPSVRGIEIAPSSGDVNVSARIFNNTILTGNSNVVPIIANGYTDTLIVKNNIIFNDRANTRCIYVGWTGLLSDIDYKDIDYNHYYTHGGDPVRFYDGTGYQTWAQWQALGYDAHSDTTQIYFSDVWGTTIPSYKLLGGSPGIDEGTDLSAYLTTDIVGTPRPQHTFWDMGAFDQ